MDVIMNSDAREENIMAVVKAIESVGLTAKICLLYTSNCSCISMV